MTPTLIITLVVAFLIIDAVLIAIFLKKRGSGVNKRDSHMLWLAENLQMNVSGGDLVFPQFKFLSFLKRSLKLEGDRRGIPLQIYHYAVSTGNSSTTYTTVRTSLENPKGLTFRFGKEGLFSKMGKSLGMQDICTGDERFDKLFMVKCSDEAFILQALLPQVREKFLDVWERHKAKGRITLKDTALSYDEVGSIRNEAARERIAAIAELICDLGGIMQYYNR